MRRKLKKSTSQITVVIECHAASLCIAVRNTQQSQETTSIRPAAEDRQESSAAFTSARDLTTQTNAHVRIFSRGGRHCVEARWLVNRIGHLGWNVAAVLLQLFTGKGNTASGSARRPC